MYKYVWIIMLILIDVIWSVTSISDIIHAVRKFNKPLDHLKEFTVIWICGHLVALFITSFSCYVFN